MARQNLASESGRTDTNWESSTGNRLRNRHPVPLTSVQDDRIGDIGEEPIVCADSQNANNIIEGSNHVQKQVAKLSPTQLAELITPPKPASISSFSDGSKFNGFQEDGNQMLEQAKKRERWSTPEHPDPITVQTAMEINHIRKRSGSAVVSPTVQNGDTRQAVLADLPPRESLLEDRPLLASRTLSTPAMKRKTSNFKGSGQTSGANVQVRSMKPLPAPLDFDVKKSSPKPPKLDDGSPSPMPSSIPLPPLSLPTYIHLELSSERPSPLYIHRSATSDFPYESSQVKLERLLNFLLLPPQLEQVLWFGALACLDAWLYSFTILPLRFLKALCVLCVSWGQNFITEGQFMCAFIYAGIGRLWRRSRGRLEMIPEPLIESSTTINKSTATNASTTLHPKLSPLQTEFPSQIGVQRGAAVSQSETIRKRHHHVAQKQRRNKSVPSALLPDHKADILTGLLILFSCIILMHFDASMMYHSIRGQAAIKLYVIYNVLEVRFHL